MLTEISRRSYSLCFLSLKFLQFVIISLGPALVCLVLLVLSGVTCGAVVSGQLMLVGVSHSVVVSHGALLGGSF